MAQTRKKKTQGQGLKLLRIQNFQAHKKTVLKLHPGINVITGSSHHGKTAIIRALRKLVFNTPRGAKWYRNSAPKKGKAVIKTKSFDGTTVATEINVSKKVKDGKTVKKMTKQKYQVVSDIGTFDYKGGRYIPDMVVENLNLLDINFQLQHDPPLLLSSSNLKLAKLVSDITRLDRAYEVKADLQKRMKKGETEEALTAANVRRLKKELDKYGDLKELDKAVTKLGIAEEKRIRIDAEISKLEAAREQLTGIDQRRAVLHKGAADVNNIFLRMREVTTGRSEVVKEISLLETAYNTVMQIRDLTKVVEDLDKEVVDALRLAKTCPTCGQSTEGL